MDAPQPESFSLHRLTYGYPGLAAQLISIYGSAAEVLLEFDPRLTPLSDMVAGRISTALTSREHLARVERDMSWSEQPRHGVITLDSPQYPKLLGQISDPPYLLFIWGEVECLNLDQLALVGSRKATPNGIVIAEKFSTELIACGFVVTSGMALGIDAAAHRGALSVGGKTIAVQGIGAGGIYPRRHERLAADIAVSGCVISEYPTGAKAHAHHFPQRNRIVTGLAKGTLVIEAAEASGSLISARIAAEQGREVFAVPGSVLSKHNEGCHRLIRQGAKLVGNIADIVEEFSEFEVKRHQRVKTYSVEEEQVLEVLMSGPNHADRILEATGIPIGKLMALLINLEIQGEIVSHSGGYRILDRLSP